MPAVIFMQTNTQEIKRFKNSERLYFICVFSDFILRQKLLLQLQFLYRFVI
jgi:hypothetical protein